MATKPTLEAIALLGEFGFEYVDPEQVGEPTPGRIADRLSEIIVTLEDAQARGNLAAVQQATEKLKRLQRAIDVWSLLASEPELPEVPQPAPIPRSVAPAPVSRPPAPPPQAAPMPLFQPAAPAPPAAPPPPPPSRPHTLSDVERFELAAAGNQEGFLRVIGSEPPPPNRKT